MPSERSKETKRKEELELNDIHLHLVYGGDVNLLGENIIS
jgi:hypothetical protein